MTPSQSIPNQSIIHKTNSTHLTQSILPSSNINSIVHNFSIQIYPPSNNKTKPQQIIFNMFKEYAFLSAKTLCLITNFYSNKQDQKYKQLQNITSSNTASDKSFINQQKKNQLSLRDQILKLIQQNQCVYPITKKIFKNLFISGGVPLNIIFKHERFTQAKSELQKIIYNPSSISSRIISMVTSPTYHTCILYGTQGIGKSFTFAIYIEMSNSILSYTKEIKTNWNSRLQQKQNNKRISDIIEVCKIIYFTIEDNSNEKTLLQSIFSQCSQNITLTQQIKNKIKKGNYLCIKQQYERQVNCKTVILIIDQINVLASIIRTQDEAISYSIRLTKQISQLRLKSQKQQEEYQLKKIRQKFNQSLNQIKAKACFAQKILEYIRIYRKCFSKTIFLSSITLQKQVVKRLNLNGQQKSSPIPLHNVEFQHNLSDITNHFLFEIQIRLNKTNFIKPPQNMNQQFLRYKPILKQSIFKKLVQHHHYCTPYQIRKNIIAYLKQKKWASYKQFIQKIYQLVKHVAKQSLNSLKQGVMKFINLKGPQKLKKQISIQLYYQAKRLLKQDQDTDDNQLDTNQFIYPTISISNSSWNYKQISMNLDQRLFKIKQSRSEYTLICFKQPPHVVKQLFREIVESYSQQDILSYCGSRGGSLFQQKLIKILSYQYTQLHMKCLKQKAAYIKESFVLAEKILTFEPIKKSNKLTSIVNYILPQLLTNIDANYLLVPLSYQCCETDYKDFIKSGGLQRIYLNTISPNSKKIDFILTSVIEENSQIKVILKLYDATISAALIRSKLQDFLKQYVQFNDRYECQQYIDGKLIKVKIQYYVITCQQIFQSEFQKVVNINNLFDERQQYYGLKFMKNDQSTFFVVQNKQKSNQILSKIGVTYFSINDIKNKNYDYAISINKLKEVIRKIKSKNEHPDLDYILYSKEVLTQRWHNNKNSKKTSKKHHQLKKKQ